jgi:hypothetical protein
MIYGQMFGQQSVRPMLDGTTQVLNPEDTPPVRNRGAALFLKLNETLPSTFATSSGLSVCAPRGTGANTSGGPLGSNSSSTSIGMESPGSITSTSSSEFSGSSFSSSSISASYPSGPTESSSSSNPALGSGITSQPNAPTTTYLSEAITTNSTTLYVPITVCLECCDILIPTDALDRLLP